MYPTPPDGLRPWRLTDAPALAAAWADDTIRLWNPPPPDADPASWISRCGERWSLRLSIDFVIDRDGDVAGEVGLRNFTDDPARAELGIWVDQRHRRQGLGLSRLQSIVPWAADELGLQQLWSRTAVDNEGAQALFEAAGWARLGTSEGRVIFAASPRTARLSP